MILDGEKATDGLGAVASTWWPVLHDIPLFAAIEGEEVDCLNLAKEVRLRDGEVLVTEGDPPGPFFVVVEGSLYATRRLNHRDTFFMRFPSGSYFGHELILLGTPYQATARSEGASVVLLLEEHAFWQMLTDCPSINRSLLRTTAERARMLEALAQHDARMVALNKLAAGLAHELNNPAAALARTGHSLALASQLQINALIAFLSLDVSPVIRSQLGALIAELSSTTRTAPVDDDAEDFWMDEIGALGAPQAVFLASSLAKCGKTPDNIAWLRDTAPELRKIIFDLSEATLCLSHQGAHVRSCSNKISQIVAGVKSYAVLDQEPVQDIDVNASLDRAISVFQGTLPGTVVIARSLAEDLRTVQGPALELNLVWTSLLDNARAALPATGGLVTLRTYRDGPLVAVEVTDNGCGIPDDLKDRLFEPFFTTRDVGSGVGLGLFMSRRIIVERFGGDIRIRSRPGETTVLVHL